MPSRKHSFPLAWLSLAVALTVGACLSPPEYPIEPEVTFVGLSRDTMTQNFKPTDSVTVVVSFTDGDGDIVFPEGDTTRTVFIVDRETQSLRESYKLDPIDEIGLENGISGELRLVVYTTCCEYPPGVPRLPCDISPEFPVDQLLLDVYMKDRAGNESNRAQLAPIYLRCDRR